MPPKSPNGIKNVVDGEANVTIEQSDTNDKGEFVQTAPPADDVEKDSSPGKSLHEIIAEKLKDSREKIIDSPEEKEEDDEDEPESSTGDLDEDEDDQSEEDDEDEEGEPKGTQGKPEDTQGEQDEEEDVTKIPPNLKADTKIRFEKLVESNNSLKTKVDSLEQFKQNTQDISAATGSSPEQMADMFEMLRMFNSLDRDENLDALKALGRISKGLAQRIGERIPGDDLLADYPDLKEKVDQLEMTLADAEEVALTKNKLKVFQEGEETNKKNREAQSVTDNEIAEAQNKIVNLATHWQNNDPNWKAVQAEVLEYAKTIGGKYPVNIVPQVLEDFYHQAVNRLKLAKKSRKKAKEEMPLSSSSARPGRSAPKSHSEAVGGSLAKSRVA